LIIAFGHVKAGGNATFARDLKKVTGADTKAAGTLVIASWEERNSGLWVVTPVG
jgi:hypothetical protein